MRSLFLKIFLSFWLTIVLMGVPFYFIALKHRPDQFHPGMHDFEMQALLSYGQEMQLVWQEGGLPGLQHYVDTVREQSGLRIYPFAKGAAMLEGEKLPDAALRIALGEKSERPGRAPFRPGEKWLGRQLPQAEDAPGSPDFIALQLPAPPPPMHPGPPGFGPWNNIFLYSLAGGLVCFFLARSLTAPIRKLREATNRIAGGDFSVRMGVELANQSREIKELGNDFDVMAEKIEGLLSTQKQLLRDISHELRSPLARLNVAVELARNNPGTETGNHLDRIEKESQRINALIAELLIFTRMDTNSMALEGELFQLDEVARCVAADARYEADGSGREIILHTPKMPLSFRGTRKLVQRALENVVRNALQYTAPGSAVSISLFLEKSGVQENAIFQVEDYGPGVPEFALAHLFEPFYRVDEARERQSGGVGLGLAIAERAIRLHGGGITAVNAANHSGLLVTIRLPLGAVRDGAATSR